MNLRLRRLVGTVFLGAALSMAGLAVAASPALADDNTAGNVGAGNGNQVDAPVQAPINVDCNAASIIGDATAHCKPRDHVHPPTESPSAPVSTPPHSPSTPPQTTPAGNTGNNSPTLPVTGTPVALFAGAAVALIAGGAVAVRVARRRDGSSGAAA